MRKPKQACKIISPDERNQLIAEAAYFLAERRGFQGGCSLEDWLAAEREINQLYFQAAPLRGALVFIAREQQLHSESTQESEASDESVEVA